MTALGLMDILMGNLHYVYIANLVAMLVSWPKFIIVASACSAFFLNHTPEMTIHGEQKAEVRPQHNAARIGRYSQFTTSSQTVGAS